MVGHIQSMQCIIRTQGGKSGFDVNWSYSLSINRACAEKLFSLRLMLHCLYPESNCEDFLVYQGFILLTETLFMVYVHWERLYNILIFFYLISICQDDKKPLPLQSWHLKVYTFAFVISIFGVIWNYKCHWKDHV